MGESDAFVSCVRLCHARTLWRVMNYLIRVCAVVIYVKGALGRILWTDNSRLNGSRRVNRLIIHAMYYVASCVCVLLW